MGVGVGVLMGLRDRSVEGGVVGVNVGVLMGCGIGR